MSAGSWFMKWVLVSLTIFELPPAGGGVTITFEPVPPPFWYRQSAHAGQPSYGGFAADAGAAERSRAAPAAALARAAVVALTALAVFAVLAVFSVMGFRFLVEGRSGGGDRSGWPVRVGRGTADGVSGSFSPVAPHGYFAVSHLILDRVERVSAGTR
ncbi:hypothetical protein GCM10018785_31710 [Streptomyces longispororuber]|uniref:Uncharacterized protein n=1 Tax=Streptomyces longispororuber TaxID=68230 RepID=A0A919DNI1_9ACTN|nr:hypothetical protein GCM10018785_31710 [Streptomyces longispororuber]